MIALSVRELLESASKPLEGQEVAFKSGKGLLKDCQIVSVDFQKLSVTIESWEHDFSKVLKATDIVHKKI